MGLTRLTSSPLVLDVSDLKDHLRIDGAQDDATLDALQRAAIDHIERTTRTQIGQATFKLTADRFPSGRTIRLPLPPVVGVGSVVYTDPAGDAVTLNADAYTVDKSELPGRIVLKSGRSWPTTADEPASVQITFTAGHEPGHEPDTLKHLVRLIVGAWFESREGSTDRRYDELPLPFAVTSLLSLHSFPEVP